MNKSSDMFNTRSRKRNIIRTSLVSGASNVLNILLQFIYRTIFIMILSREYLGIEGLFSNILQVLSLSDLGISTVITYRLYEPIKNKDTEKISALMFFYKKIYRRIAVFIFVVGICMLPFLGYLIKDPSEIPEDINIKFVYLLFLMQSVSSYFFAYRQTILSADQKYDKLSILLFLGNILKCIIQTLTLILTGSYTITLMAAILENILFNGGLAWFIGKEYWKIFHSKNNISSEEKQRIYLDTKAMMCHKIGGTILGSTDNIILSTFIGLGMLGKYSNYSLITGTLQKMMGQLLGNFSSSIGNAHVSEDKEYKYKMYEKLLFLNFWIANVFSAGLYSVIDPFISWWQEDDMTLDKLTTLVICLCFHYNISRLINTTFINGCGLFNRDKARPLIQAFINLFVSIYLVKRLGIAGVFVGTLISDVLTVWWREPYLLYRYVFRISFVSYWKNYAVFLLTLLIACTGTELLFYRVEVTFAMSLIKGLTAVFVVNVLQVVFGFRNDSFRYYISLLSKQFKRIKKDGKGEGK